jgi:hypothetical protein
VTEDLEKTCVALEPFKDSDFEQLAAYLTAADDYRRTGTLPFPLPKPRKARVAKPAAPKVPKKVKLDEAALRDLAQKVRGLQERALLPEVTRETLEAELAALPLAQLDKSGALSVAGEAGMVVKAKTTLKDAIDWVRRSVLNRKEAVENLKV